MSEKRITCRRRTGEDRISLLPDHLLCEILSHVPTKMAVMTSFLSTRWRTIWLSVPLLDLHTDDFPNFTALASFIFRFLDASSCLHKLKLAFGFRRTIQDISNDLRKFPFKLGRIIRVISNNDLSYLMKHWINNAVTRKVQHVDILYPWIVEIMMMPLGIYTIETLVSLKLRNVSLPGSEYVSLPRLKIMHLVGNVYTNDAFLEKLISSCPVLEELTVVRNIDREYDLRVLRVRSKSLKSLVVVLGGIDYKASRVVVIDAPGLNYLRLKDDQFTSYVISNLSSSAKVEIDVLFDVDVALPVMDSTERSVVRRFFTMLSSVRDMTISLTSFEAICRYLKHEPLPQFPYLIRLHVVLYNSDSGNLPNILGSCPNLKSLVLVMKLYLYNELNKLKEEDLLIFSSSVPECLRSSLEYVEMTTPTRGAVAEIELVKYLLENSAVLKKLKMRLRRGIVNEESNILMGLLRLRRCSPSCEVVAQIEEVE